MTLRLLAGLLCLLIGLAPAAASVAPFCQYSTDPGGFIENARYRVYDAWQAADLVAVVIAPAHATNGQPQPVEVRGVIKGAVGGRVELVGPRCAGTACRGLRIAAQTEFLLLLRRLPDGTWTGVDREDGGACPNVFAVANDTARIGGESVPVPLLRQYFEGRPPPIPFGAR